MKKLFIYLSLLFISNLALGQNIALPGSDGAVFQRKGVGQGADLELGINFNDSNLSSVQAYVEQYSVGNNTPNLYMNWTTYSCDAYPGIGGNYKRVKITLPGGLFKVKFRRTDNTGVVTPEKIMGVGEVFYVAGQSNTTGVGSITEPASSATYNSWVKFENNKDETSVFLANQNSTNCPDCSQPNSLCNQSFPRGKNGNDPSSSYRSHWRLFAEKLVNKLNVPVAIFQAGWADTSIEEWSTAADGNKVCKYYQNSVDAITTYPYYNLKYLFDARKYNGVRAILWHQGERDGAGGTTYSTYKSNLENLISKSRTHIKASMGVSINVPWVISQASISNGVTTKSAITSAQNDVSQQSNNSLGPNTDNIGNRFDGTHFDTNGLTDLANAWCDKIIDMSGNFKNTSSPIPAFGNVSGNSLTLSQTSWSPDKNVNTLNVGVTSNIAWSVTSDQPWLTYTSTGTSGNGNILLSVTANSSTSSPRTGSITVSGSGVSQTISVTQSGTSGEISCANGTFNVASATYSLAGGNANLGIVFNASNMYRMKWTIKTQNDVFVREGFYPTSSSEEITRNDPTFSIGAALTNGDYKLYLTGAPCDNRPNTCNSTTPNGFPFTVNGISTSKCPRQTNNPFGWEYWDFGQSVWQAGNWFAWDNANGRILFAVKEGGLTYVSTSPNPGGSKLSQAAFELAVANPALRSCPFTYGTSNRISSPNNEISEVFNVFPNPTSGKVTVDFSLESAEDVWINLYNSQGRSMDLKNIIGKEGNNSIELDIKHYPVGTYFINLQSSQKREVKKIVKVD